MTTLTRTRSFIIALSVLLGAWVIVAVALAFV